MAIFGHQFKLSSRGGLTMTDGTLAAENFEILKMLRKPSLFRRVDWTNVSRLRGCCMLVRRWVYNGSAQEASSLYYVGTCGSDVRENSDR